MDHYNTVKQKLQGLAHHKKVIFALKCAERVLPLFEEQRPNDSRPRAALDEVKLWLAGKSSRERLRAAADAAANAAGYAARIAAHNAAYAAAYAASDAAWGAAYDTGWTAPAANYAIETVKDKEAEQQWQLNLLEELGMDFIGKWKKKREVNLGYQEKS